MFLVLIFGHLARRPCSDFLANRNNHFGSAVHPRRVHRHGQAPLHGRGSTPRCFCSCALVASAFWNGYRWRVLLQQGGHDGGQHPLAAAEGSADLFFSVLRLPFPTQKLAVCATRFFCDHSKGGDHSGQDPPSLSREHPSAVLFIRIRTCNVRRVSFCSKLATTGDKIPCAAEAYKAAEADVGAVLSVECTPFGMGGDDGGERGEGG